MILDALILLLEPHWPAFLAGLFIACLALSVALYVWARGQVD